MERARSGAAPRRANPTLRLRMVTGRFHDVQVEPSTQLQALTSLLYPGARWHSPSDQGAITDYRVCQSYLPLPNVAGAPLLVPVDTKPAAAALLERRGKAAHTSGKRLAYRLAALGMASGLLQRALPARLELLLPADSAGEPPVDASLVAHLGMLLNSEVVVGTKVPRVRDPHRSMNLLVFDNRGDFLAFAKVGWNELTRERVRTEAAALSKLAARPRRLLHAPRLLHTGSWNDLELVVTSPIDPIGERRSSAGPSLDVLYEVAMSGAHCRLPLVRSEYWQRTEQRIHVLMDSPTLDQAVREFLANCLSELRKLGASPLEFGGWHGDFMPWNQSTKGDQTLAWDWEYWTDSAPWGFDVLHFFCGIFLYRNKHDVRDALERARPLAFEVLRGLPGHHLDAIYALYVVELMIRRLEITSLGGSADDARIYPSIFDAARHALALAIADGTVSTAAGPRRVASETSGNPMSRLPLPGRIRCSGNGK